MTSKERIYAVVQGQPVDQTPLIIWPGSDVHSDAAIVSIKRLVNAGTSPRAMFAEILSPFARAMQNNFDLNQALKHNPDTGNEALNALIAETEQQIRYAVESKVDGIFYRLRGAEPAYSTPMQYGGHYLEADRRLLTMASAAPVNILHVEGGPELYIDFVSDLPAEIFAWDHEGTGIAVASVRKLRAGTLASSDPEADVLFGHNYGLLQPSISKTMAETNV